MRHNFVQFLLLLFLLQISAIAADEQIPAVVTGVMNMGWREIRVSFKPQLPLPSLSSFKILFHGEKIGTISGIYPEGEKMVGFFNAKGKFKMRRGMSILLLYHESKKNKPLSLPVSIVQSGKKIFYEIPAGKGKKIQVGQHFSVKLCQDISPLNLVVVKVSEKTSDLKFSGTLGSYGNDKAILKKITELMISKKIASNCHAPFYAVEIKHTHPVEVTYLQNMPKEFNLGNAGGRGNGNSNYVSSGSYCKHGDIMAHVYNSWRLKVINSCMLVSGTVDTVRPERDGDYHINIILDNPYQRLLDGRNYSGEHGDLVVEAVCEHSVTQIDAITACEGYHNSIRKPEVGSHVYVVGPYVLDKDHGWMEIHPAWYIGTSPLGATIVAPSNENPQQGNQKKDNQCQGETLCRDGTCSEATGRGACSRHGGVKRW